MRYGDKETSSVFLAGSHQARTAPEETNVSPLMDVKQIGHLTLETADLERQVDYFTQVLGLGLVAKTAETAFLACPADRYSIVLERGSEARCRALALQLAIGTDLADLARHLGAVGIPVESRRDPGPDVGETLVLTGPEGLVLELYTQVEGGLAMPKAGIRPRKLGHVAFNVVDVQKTVDFFVEIMGFRVSDWMGDFFAFLRCGPDHHTVNFVHGARAKMHHVAFEALDWNQLKDASDFLGHRRIPILWGPGRHPVGHNLFTYHHNPDRHIIELYAELDQMSDEASGVFDPRPWHAENPRRPKVWEPGLFTSNLWGLPSPPAFRE